MKFFKKTLKTCREYFYDHPTLRKILEYLFTTLGAIISAFLFAFGYKASEVVNMLGIFHMPIFFYISGFFLYKEDTNLRGMLNKLYKRILNLLIPYLVFGILWCSFSKSNFITMFLSGGGRYWFLYTLFIISTFFLIYEYVIGRCKNTLIYVTLWIVPYIILIATKVYLNTNGGQYM